MKGKGERGKRKGGEQEREKNLKGLDPQNVWYGLTPSK